MSAVRKIEINGAHKRCPIDSAIVMLCAMLVTAGTPAGMSHDHHEFTDVMISHHHELYTETLKPTACIS
jgi:hypothetical protein